MLKVTDLHVSYGAIHAIHGISLEVNEGEIVSLIGANVRVLLYQQDGHTALVQLLDDFENLLHQQR